MIILAFIILAAIMKAVMDSLQFHYSASIFRFWNADFWNPHYSWKNKYKHGNPKFGEKFFGSTTFFVFLTDGWHLAQFFFLNSMIAAIVTYEPIFNVWLDFILLGIGFRVVFQIFFKDVFSK